MQPGSLQTSSSFLDKLKRLTQPVDVSLQPVHPLEDPLVPDGVIVVDPLESLRVAVDLPLNGAKVEQSRGHDGGHQ